MAAEIQDSDNNEWWRALEDVPNLVIRDGNDDEMDLARELHSQGHFLTVFVSDNRIDTPYLYVPTAHELGRREVQGKEAIQQFFGQIALVDA